MAVVAGRRGVASDESGGALLERVERSRVAVSRTLPARTRAENGQFLTPLALARFMAAMVPPRDGWLRILDPGAGVGTLAAALVVAACSWKNRPSRIAVTAYEIEPAMLDALAETFDGCAASCGRAGVRFESTIRPRDFVRDGVETLLGSPSPLRPCGAPAFDVAILNPPYRKIRTDSEARRLLATVGLETTNLYAAFAWLALRLLDDGGDLVAITPRSFCNGPYFEPFRRDLIQSSAFRRVHVFESRTRAFADDDVLQENVVVHVTKGAPRSRLVISASHGPGDEALTIRDVEHDEVVRPDDPHAFIHIATGDRDGRVARQMRGLDARLDDLELSVSTGRVVDFRARHLLRTEPGRRTAPLIHPGHLSNGSIAWPNPKLRKPSALALTPEAAALLVPAGAYVLVKRFTSKEERRRVVAAVLGPSDVPGFVVGFENHLNYYHRHGRGVPYALARGLAVFLRSTLVDAYFRQFSGHTQVNATDLRNLRYPSVACLRELGRRVGRRAVSQHQIDALVADVLQRPREGR